MRLLGEFMSGSMISLAMSDGSRGMGVGGEVVEFCDSIVRALWHRLSPYKEGVAIKGAIWFCAKRAISSTNACRSVLLPRAAFSLLKTPAKHHRRSRCE